MDDWQVVELPGSGLRFRYPTKTPGGHNVEIDAMRLHARSVEGGELYFEVSKEPSITAEQQYERERRFLERAADQPTISELTNTVVRGHAAFRFNVAWPERDRVFTLIEHEGALYRFVYDPRSQLNEQIFDTFELT